VLAGGGALALTVPRCPDRRFRLHTPLAAAELPPERRRAIVIFEPRYPTDTRLAWASFVGERE
jgi:5-methylcytosine-specific restriction endonuclease McrA